MKHLSVILSMALVLCFAVSCQDEAAIAELEEAKAQAKEAMAELDAMRAQAKVEEQNTSLARDIFEEFNKGNVDVFKESYAPDYKYYSPSRTTKPLSREETIEFVKTILAAFPDASWNIEESFASGNRVILRFIFRGTHEGEYQGIPATGNRIEVSSFLIYRIEDGKVVEEREEYELLGMMEQLGMELRPKEDEE